MRFSCPGKTFLLGEYLALVGGLSLVVATRPRFIMTVKSSLSSCDQLGEHDMPSRSNKGTLLVSEIDGQSKAHPLSPAGRFAEQYDLSMIDFEDGYGELGGFGASTAQFLGVWAAARGLPSEGANWTAAELLKAYRAVAWNGEGWAPSGVDLLAQWQGGLTWIETSKLADSSGIRGVTWPFTDLHFSLFHTQKKLATHEHLRLAKEFSVDSLARIVLRAQQAFENGDPLSFANAIGEYGINLSEQGLVASHTLEILGSLRAQSIQGVLSAKGCGALGADVILVLHRPQAFEPLRRWGVGIGMHWIADQRSIDTRGLMSSGDESL